MSRINYAFPLLELARPLLLLPGLASLFYLSPRVLLSRALLSLLYCYRSLLLLFGKSGSSSSRFRVLGSNSSIDRLLCCRLCCVGRCAGCESTSPFLHHNPLPLRMGVMPNSLGRV